mmetsp:Transcript_30321/g.88664  ORF Transcript_30321/g.88664 Transcript_30321/m.88664 type:complete len:361 (+) Transcript_30321:180-1262(+)
MYGSIFMARPELEDQPSLHIAATHDEDDDSVDSNYDEPLQALESGATGGGSPSQKLSTAGVKATLESERYDADTIREEFKTYQHLLPRPEQLLQQQHSFPLLRTKIEENNVKLPRFLRYKSEGGIKPHHALCCLLLSEYEAKKEERKRSCRGPSWVQILTFGALHRQINNPAAFIRDQFDRVAPVIPTDVVTPHALRKKIKNRGLPVPNYFLDPEDGKQFPPHIALLVTLQDGEKESQRLNSILYSLAFSLFAVVALLLRIVLEVIGGAGAIWGGAECFGLRNATNNDDWRWFSVAIGVLCFARFITLHIPQMEDEGDILGPAGPWSLRLPVRLRAVCDHPFHYFVRALPPSKPSAKKVD